MEYFGARDSRPLEVCQEEVRQSDLLVVIVGHRYGTIAPGHEVSFSEAEYRLGVELGKPCYVFIASDEVPVPPRDTEQDPEKLRKLQAWNGPCRIAIRSCISAARSSWRLASWLR
jgi:Domain of unknown function (DUF4062)